MDFLISNRFDCLLTLLDSSQLESELVSVSVELSASDTTFLSLRPSRLRLVVPSVLALVVEVFPATVREFPDNVELWLLWI